MGTGRCAVLNWLGLHPESICLKQPCEVNRTCLCLCTCVCVLFHSKGTAECPWLLTFCYFNFLLCTPLKNRLGGLIIVGLWYHPTMLVQNCKAQTFASANNFALKKQVMTVIRAQLYSIDAAMRDQRNKCSLNMRNLYDCLSTTGCNSAHPIGMAAVVLENKHRTGMSVFSLSLTAPLSKQISCLKDVEA